MKENEPFCVGVPHTGSESIGDERLHEYRTSHGKETSDNTYERALVVDGSLSLSEPLIGIGPRTPNEPCCLNAPDLESEPLTKSAP